MDPAVSLDHRALLLRVSDRLRSEELDRLLFLCRGHFYESPREEKLDDSLALFRELEYRCYLEPGSYMYLKGCLMIIQRPDLADMLPAKADSRSYSRQSFTNIRKVLYDISKQLGKEDLEAIEFMYGIDASRGIDLIKSMEKSRQIEEGSYERLAEILRSICRYDLSQRLLPGIPITLPNSMTVQSLALQVMIEGMKERFRDYTVNFEILRRIAHGEDTVVKSIFNKHRKYIVGALDPALKKSVPSIHSQSSLEVDPSIKTAISEGFRCLWLLLGKFVADVKSQECCTSLQLKPHPSSWTKDVTYQSCKLGESAFIANDFIEKVSNELIGVKDYKTQSVRVQYAISICSKAVVNVPALLSNMSKLLNDARSQKIDIRLYHEELTNAFLQHSRYITELLPVLKSFISEDNLQVLSENLDIFLEPTRYNTVPDYGYLRLITIPTYTILLHLLSYLHGGYLSFSPYYIQKMKEYLEDTKHYAEARTFIKSCGKALLDEVLNYREKTLERCEEPIISNLLVV